MALKNRNRCTQVSEAGINGYKPLNAQGIIPAGIIPLAICLLQD